MYGTFPYQNNTYGYGGYSAPMYQQPQQNIPQQQPVNTNKIYATGIEDVRCRQLPANSDYIFLDNDKPLVYRKTTDATGKMDIQVFKITPYQEEEAQPTPSIDMSQYVLRKDFDSLKTEIDKLRDSVKSLRRGEK
jgi:hypothetical protein